jgi:TPR repeat protein
MKRFFLLALITASQILAASTTSAAEDASQQPTSSSGKNKQYDAAIHKLKNGGTENLKEVFDLLTASAKQKHPEAIGTLGYLYANGIFVEKDDAIARKYFQEAVELGSKDSRRNLGLFLVYGRGGAQDWDKGISLLGEMVREGNNQAAIALGEVYYMGDQSANRAPDYAKAYEVLIAPANAGSPIAQNFLGIMLKDGKLGAVNIDEAKVWLEKAAWQGNPKACANLSDMWDYQSENRNCRIESLRWMMVADALDEIVSKFLLADITPQLAKDEEIVARDLAAITLEIIKDRK